MANVRGALRVRASRRFGCGGHATWRRARRAGESVPERTEPRVAPKTGGERHARRSAKCASSTRCEGAPMCRPAEPVASSAGRVPRSGDAALTPRRRARTPRRDSRGAIAGRKTSPLERLRWTRRRSSPKARTSHRAHIPARRRNARHTTTTHNAAQGPRTSRPSALPHAPYTATRTCPVTRDGAGPCPPKRPPPSCSNTSLTTRVREPGSSLGRRWTSANHVGSAADVGGMGEQLSWQRLTLPPSASRCESRLRDTVRGSHDTACKTTRTQAGTLKLKAFAKGG
jgi:hypothetical protein